MRTFMVTCFVFCTVNTSFGEEPLTQYEKAARDFSFDKVKLGISLSDFKKTHPNAKSWSVYMDNDDEAVRGELALRKVGVIVAVDNTSYGAVGAYRFLDGKLYEIRAIYNSKTLDAIGGAGTLTEKVVSKIGKSNEDKAEKEKSVTYYWNFPKVERKFSYKKEMDKDVVDSIIFTFVDSKLHDVYTERLRKNAKTGLDDK